MPIFSNTGVVLFIISAVPTTQEALMLGITLGNEKEGQSLWDLYKYSSYRLNTWSNVKPTPLLHKFLLIQKHVHKEPVKNDFSYGAEQPQTCFAGISELSPLARTVLKSKAMKIKQIIDITAIACTVMYAEAMLQFWSLVCREQKLLHLTGL